MNLLVTNTRNAQAYAIIRALRPHAQKIVATMEGDNRWAARLSHAANSRLVDKRYYTPSPAADWRAGRIQKENTAGEEAYVRAVLEICEKEKIDTIYPSFDPHVYVFAKNKERFEKFGIVMPVPDFEILINLLDKHRTIQAAREAGFPCPKTYLPECKERLEEIAGELGFPLVFKPRFSAAGRGFEVVNNFAELSERIRGLADTHSMPLLQEYVPGNRKADFHLVVDRDGAVKSRFSAKKHRSFRIKGGYGTGQESVVPHPQVKEAARFLHRLGWWGGALVETMIDSRDGIPKLLEINPRFGNRLWVRTELGINDPLLCMQIARGEKVGPGYEYPAETLLLDPVEDMLLLGYHLADLALYRWRVEVLGRSPLDDSSPPMSVRELFASYRLTYFGGKKKLFNPYFRHFFRDPLVSLLWWAQYAELVWRALPKAGK